MAGKNVNRVTLGERLAEYPPETPQLNWIFVLAFLSVAGGAVLGALCVTSCGAPEAAGYALFTGGFVGLLLSPIPAGCLRKTKYLAVVGAVGIPTAVVTVLGGALGTSIADANTGFTLGVMLSVGTFLVLSITIGGLSTRGYRRADLRARGHCLKCGYDRWGITGPCPECGCPPS